MKFGWLISLIGHGVIVAVSMVALSKNHGMADEGDIIPVELLTVADHTNIKAAVKPKTPEIITPSEPMQLETPMENADEAGREKERSASEVRPNAAATTPVEGGQTPVKTQPEKPVFDLDNMSALVDKARAAQPETGQQKALQSEKNIYDFAENSRESAGLGDALTMSELDALQTAMYKCWRIPLDAKNPEDLVIRVKVRLRGDGHVLAVRLLDAVAVNSSDNPYMRIAAQRAVNAVTKCAPYDFLPLDKYGSWKDMTLRFKPEL